MHRSRTGFLIVAALLLCGCATPNIGSNYRLDETSGRGLVIGSVTYQGRLSEYKMFYRPMPTGKAAFFKAGQGQVPPFPHNDFATAGATGELFSAELPAGRYEFFGWGIHSGGAGTQSTEPFSIEFVVTPGRPIYLGNFHFAQERSLGLTVTGATVYHRLQTERDLARFKNSYPQLAEHQIEVLTPPFPADHSVGNGYQTELYLLPVHY
ncbi:hypothetical protein FBY03_10240 [Pseudomonas sp. SJZ079]|uniref:hypothetical protein n=1 Tax=Pseudomonas sp. SJZ079 TaxID=2572887 RepID=UPI0011994396|nr:hypothetical protein [Pseudomonas sp. SJZ079]TWC41295.1 hypothetical protein FBY03_10240 [Pseudomonas sp. SJZ079]